MKNILFSLNLMKRGAEGNFAVHAHFDFLWFGGAELFEYSLNYSIGNNTW